MDSSLMYESPEFNSGLSLKYKLSILFRQDGFSFAISDAFSKDILILSSYNFTSDKGNAYQLNNNEALNDFFATNKYLNYSYSKVNVFFETQHVQLFPLEFEDDNLIDLSFNLLISDSSEKHKISNTLIPNVLNVIGLVDNASVSYAHDLYDNPNIFTTNYVFLKSLLSGNVQTDDVFFVNINYNFIEIAFIEKNNVSFYNTFSYKTNEDILYYILFVVEQLGYSHMEYKIALTGSTKNDLLNLLKKYINNVNLLDDYEKSISNISSDIDKSKYYILLQSALCE
ncbi:MAG: DUF3822 family protein [Bacteroidales bacterium]